MNCGRCGSSNLVDARFCAGCGAGLVVTCATCGSKIPGGGAFCGSCGQPAEDNAGYGQGVAVARYALEPMLRSRAMIEGERKEITVLFADTVGLTELAEHLDPEQAMARLDGVFKLMRASVRRFGGLDRAHGDGIIALFGAPLADQDHAARACFAALAMQRAVAHLAEDGVTIRVGVHSGPAVVRSVRTELAAYFDAVGDTVHLAARMETAAAPGTIRITGDTHRLAKDFVVAHRIGVVPVRGMREGVEQFELVDRTSLRTLWERRAASRFTPFVARQAELAALRAAAAAAAAGAGKLFLISGDSGSGKSRLVHEFARGLETGAWTVLRSGAMPFSINAPYAMLAMLLRVWLGLDDGDPVSGDRLRSALGAWPGAGPWRHAALAALLSLPGNDADWRALDPDARGRLTVETLRGWLAWLAEERPLLLVFEDVHWADSESLAILALLARHAAASKLLILATRRYGGAGEPVGDAHAVVLTVGPLPTDAAREMLDHLLGGDPGLVPLKRLLVETSAGVPFFLEELTRALTETGALDDTLHGYRQRVNLDDIRVPSSVRLVLASRIDRLSAPEKELLQVASVIGREVSMEILQAVAALPEGEVRKRVLGLETAGFLRLTASGLVFENMLTRDVAYETLLLTRRRALHESAVEALEAQGGEQVYLLAHHAFQGRLWPKALEYVVRAAHRAVELSAFGEAIKLLEQALEALTHLPRDAETLAQGIDLRLALRGVLGTTLDFPRIGRFLDEAKDIALEIGDRRRLGAIAISEAMMHNQHGDCDRAIAAARVALSVAEEFGDETLAIPARIYLGQAHLWRGELAEALAALGADLAWTRGPLRRRRLGTTGASAVNCLGFLAQTCAFAGRFRDAESFSGEAVAIAEEVGRPYDLVLAKWFRGRVMSYCGRMAESLEIVQEAYRLCEAMEVRYFLPALAIVMGFVQVETGRTGEGAEALARSMATHKANALLQGEVWCVAYLGLAKLRDGDATAAEALATQALDIARAHGYAIVEVVAQRLLGAALGGLGHPAEAEDHFDRAAARAEALGLLPELGHCRFERAALLRRLGRHDEARRDLERAARLYGELGMDFWHAKARAALHEPAKGV
jgi:class 3 adenylate cyclase/tetratricopeptide (TPR) repeat protein